MNLFNQQPHWRSGLARRLRNRKRDRMTVRLFEAQIQHPGGQLRLARERAPAEGASQQLDDVAGLHVAAKSVEQLPGSEWTLQYAPGKQRGISLSPQAVDQGAGQCGGVDVRALEPLVPIPLIVNDPAVHVFLPERGPSVGA